MRPIMVLVALGLLTCIATSLWQIEGHLAAMAAK